MCNRLISTFDTLEIRQIDEQEYYFAAVRNDNASEPLLWFQQ